MQRGPVNDIRNDYRAQLRTSLENIHSSQGGSGDRDANITERLAALYESAQSHDLDACLFFLPGTKFKNLIRAVLQSIDRNESRLPDGASSLIQLTCDEELLLVMKSAWTAFRHYGSRKTFACEDMTVILILTPVMKPLQAMLPREPKSVLDEVAEKSSERRSQAAHEAEGRSRGSGKARERSRSRNLR